jgi:hypothetical protein
MRGRVASAWHPRLVKEANDAIAKAEPMAAKSMDTKGKARNTQR